MSVRVAYACALVMLASLLAGCGGLHDSTVSLKREATGTVEWNPCGDIQCGSLSVPLDRTQPNGRHISLALARLPASGHRIGVLFTNPGGPGASGVEFLRSANVVFPSSIRAAFDIISWDPRGVGASSPIDCGDQLDAFYAVDRSPDTPAEVEQNVRAAKDFVATCERNSGALLPFMSTDATVHDLDAIRAAIGADTISYVGYSYGTYLGALYANAFPKRVRAMVLDGAVDPALSYTETIVQQARGFDRELDAFFSHCRESGCGFADGGDPATAYSSLVQAIDQESIPGKTHGEQRTVGPGELDIGVASALYGGKDAWSDLGAALAQAAGGTGDRILASADAYTERGANGKYSNETAALYATSCLDGPAPTSRRGVELLASTAEKAAPHFGASTAWLGLPCTYWPVASRPPTGPIHAAGAPPILVVGNTGDPATPYEGAQALADELDSGHLLTGEGTSHTAYGRGNACIDTAVDKYLLDLTVPAEGARCS